MLIILEGLPGTGKTTLAKKLAEKYKGILIPQIILRFPYNYKNLSSCEKEQFFIKNDLEKYKKATRILQNKRWIIMDRGVLSTLAYNYAFTHLKEENTYKIILNRYKKNKKIFGLPQIIIFLKISVKDSLKRKGRLNPKNIEKKSLWVNPKFLKEMKNFYQFSLPKFKNKNTQVIKVNSNQLLRKIAQNIYKKLDGLETQNEYCYF